MQKRGFLFLISKADTNTTNRLALYTLESLKGYLEMPLGLPKKEVFLFSIVHPCNYSFHSKEYTVCDLNSSPGFKTQFVKCS